MENITLNPIVTHKRKGCGICGCKLTYIRGRYPGNKKRKVCPTCIAERLDKINELSSKNYGVAYNAKD